MNEQKEKTTKIHIFAASDEGYAQHLGVMIQSVIDNKDSLDVLCLHIVDGGMTKKSRSNINQIAADCEVNWYVVNKEKCRDFFVDRWLSMATYYRIFMPELLDESIEQVIYLDCDVVVCSSLKPLMQLEMSENLIAAVHNPVTQRVEELQMPANSVYFNAGVLVINLKGWRQENIMKKLIEYVSKYSSKLVCHDQDALNALLHSRRLVLDPCWNQMSSFFDGNVPIGRFPADEFHIACKQPKIIHYSNVSKPWHFFNTHPFLNHYTKHLQKTPWSTSLDEMNHLFIEYFTSRKIVVFGTGECSNWVKEVLNKHNLDIAWYVDNNQKKQGSFIFETAIFGPEKLLTCNLTDYVIIIASMYHQEISEQLTAMNLKEKINFMIYGYEHRFLEMLKNQ